jgi:hypothetical protein
MWLLALEACVAFGLFIFIVWWTMFHGRKPEVPPPARKIDASAPATPPAPSFSTSSAEKND